jgi:hypothetical protein
MISRLAEGLWIRRVGAESWREVIRVSELAFGLRPIDLGRGSWLETVHTGLNRVAKSILKRMSSKVLLFRSMALMDNHHVHILDLLRH